MIDTRYAPIVRTDYVKSGERHAIISNDDGYMSERAYDVITRRTIICAGVV